MKKIIVNLTNSEIKFLEEFIRKGNKKARSITRANILLLANKKEKSKKIAEILNINRGTVAEIKKKYVREGLNGALHDKPRPGQPIRYDEKKSAEVIAFACTAPPEGRKRWTLELLEKELTKREGFETISRGTIRLILKKAKQNLG